ncbi:DNA sulfur modification protein DndD [Allobacillus sp. GCM10007491]|uniref:Nuclease SbcCD subunit C n=1 Tax=Allobacillus saliphilus TaxID=2912308 RepID=A0A941CWV6_9BACI|nr:DNA sulfur modification protein DndD [Allobacillus saliphilus]MBR7553620.1 DNA sulfur modification protein DndD [Allobacillus saliphilus]
MKLKSLTLENFRVFYEKQTINFNKNKEGNITLIGGLNGAGKTSILTAINLLLYRQGANNEQKRMLDGTLNNKFYQKDGREARLYLEFESNNNTYEIIGVLKYNNNQTFRDFTRQLRSDGVYRKLSDSELQNFIDKNVPYDISSFFLFDGEKIQDLVDKQEHSSLKRPIQKIVGLNFYREVQKDILAAEDRIEKESRKLVPKSQVESLEIEKMELEDQLKKITDNIDIFNEKTQEKQIELKKYKDSKNQKIEKYYTNKGSLHQSLETLNKDIEKIKVQIQQFSQQSLPLMILSPLIEKAKEQIEIEEEYQNKKHRIQLNFEEFNEFITNLLNRDVIKNTLSENEINILEKEGKVAWAEINNIYEYELPEEIEILHNIDRNQQRRFSSLNIKDTDVKSLLERKQELEKEKEVVEEKIRNTPEIEDYKHEDTMITKLTQEVNEFKRNVNKLRSDEIKIKERLKKVTANYREKLKNIDSNRSITKQFDLIQRVQKAAQQYVEGVTNYKARCIKEDFEDIIKKLLRKNQDFSKVEFDVESFTIKIFNENGTQIRLTDRSAGEKQIIALSLIWALTKNAPLELPYVIDTPLGRLDSVHRKNLMEHYFPYLSDQVIILSTDTEVNEEFTDQLGNHMNVTYRLDYDNDAKCTTIREGYFSFKEGVNS